MITREIRILRILKAFRRVDPIWLIVGAASQAWCAKWGRANYGAVFSWFQTQEKRMQKAKMGLPQLAAWLANFENRVASSDTLDIVKISNHQSEIAASRRLSLFDLAIAKDGSVGGGIPAAEARS